MTREEAIKVLQAVSKYTEPKEAFTMAIEALSRPSIPAIKGWVARDKDYMCHFFLTQPVYYKDTGEWSNGGNRYQVPGELCHSVLNEPIEVELLIKRKEE